MGTLKNAGNAGAGFKGKPGNGRTWAYKEFRA